MLGKWENDNLVFIEGDYKMEQSVFVKVGKLKIGNYFVFIKPKWNPEHMYWTVVCSMYSSSEAGLKWVYYKKFSKGIVNVIEEMLSEWIALGKDY